MVTDRAILGFLIFNTLFWQYCGQEIRKLFFATTPGDIKEQLANLRTVYGNRFQDSLRKKALWVEEGYQKRIQSSSSNTVFKDDTMRDWEAYLMRKAIRANPTPIQSSSSNTVHKDYTIRDWEAYLMRKTNSAHHTPIQSSSSNTVHKDYTIRDWEAYLMRKTNSGHHTPIQSSRSNTVHKDYTIRDWEAYLMRKNNSTHHTPIQSSSSNTVHNDYTIRDWEAYLMRKNNSAHRTPIQLSSSNTVHKDDTIRDWEAYLMRKTIPAHRTPIQSSSSNTVYKDNTICDEAYLMRKTIPAHRTPISDPAPSLVESTVGTITQSQKHYAHISFVPSADGLRAVVSHKRKRTAFTTDQVTALEEVFRGKPYVTSEERSVLGRRLAVSDQAIKVWFQNRRLKEKKEREELEFELSQGFPENNPFAHTEGLINHADKDGLVTLDQQAVDELVTAIDKTLPQDLDLAKLIVGLRRTSKASDIVYEPISPPEVGASSQVSCRHNFQKLETINTKQEFLQLLDVQCLNYSF